MASFGVIGLGVMGQNLALNIEEHGFPVAVWNYETDWIDRFLAAHPHKRLSGAKTLEALVAAINRPRRILMMIKAGPPVDQTLAALRPLLSPGDVVVDGGNSWWKDTERREAETRASGVFFVGAGVSGGEEGARHGPCLMPGGAKEAYEILRPVFEAICAHTDAGPCVTWVGPGGAGHFVKMVHNGIEYGDMQLIAEAYEVLRRVLGLTADEQAALFAGWNCGRLESYLIELTAQILTVRNPETGRPLVELVRDAAAQKGTGRWTAETALELGIAIPTIAAAIDARILSSRKEERVAASRVLAGPNERYSGDRQALVGHLGDALYAAKVGSYAQGMNLIRAGSHQHQWNIRLSELARIWKGGCIIRARFLDDIRRAYEREPDLPSVLLDPFFRDAVANAQAGWRRTVGVAQSLGVAVPAMSASLGYYDTYRTADLPQNLIQAQRDGFGAHTYERIDHPERGPVHTDWLALSRPLG